MNLIEFIKKANASISCNYFIQGLFFGHEPENSFFQTGSTISEYSPSKSKVLKDKKWER